MMHAVVFVCLGGYLAFLAWYLGGWGYLLVWPAGSFLMLAAAYAGLGPGLLGKRPDGRLAWWSWILFGGVYAILWPLWHLQRRLTREPPCHLVAPGLWLGRRPFCHELPREVVLVVDLTAEFPAARGLIAGREYVALPTLDATAPPVEPFAALVERLVPCKDAIYIHCAAGHGRSATVAAAVLLARGLAEDVHTAEQQLRRARPGVRLKPAQRRLLRRLYERGEK